MSKKKQKKGFVIVTHDIPVSHLSSKSFFNCPSAVNHSISHCIKISDTPAGQTNKTI